MTLKEVAERAQVAISTVSAVINNSAPVSERTRQRVLKAIKALNYRPNRLARSLKTKQSFSVGVIVPDLTNPFFPEVVRGIESVARQHAYNIILCDTDEKQATGVASLNLLIEKQVDGVILVGGVIPKANILSLGDNVLPIVMIEKDYDIPWISIVMVDAKKGAYDSVNHLINLGHRRISFITERLPRSKIQRRFEGYKLALKHNGIAFDSLLVKEVSPTFEGGYKAMNSLLSMEEPPDAVFAYNDLMAIGALKSIHAIGLKVPNDIAVVGFDDIQAASFTSPPLTTVALPKHEMGVKAMQLILELISGKGKHKKILLPTKLVVRESCGQKKASSTDSQ
ncbi:MAG TPA: LacI family transcriptional regulator [bacterium (Candidatus Stahlbacteria)]|nr:LacI family transcriptional regulator [Candidatus Stahlbacteria bacterium]